MKSVITMVLASIIIVSFQRYGIPPELAILAVFWFVFMLIPWSFEAIDSNEAKMKERVLLRIY